MYCSRCGTWTPDSSSTCARCGQSLAPQVPVVQGVEVVAAPPAEAAFIVAAPAVHFAGFWRRAAAMFVDGLLLFFPDAIVRTSLGLPTPFAMHTLRDDETGRLLAVLVAMTAVWWLYCALLESSHWRGTLGQQLMGVRVGDREGRRISFGRASVRYFAQWVSMVICGLGYLFNLWTPRRQTLHDMIAGCVLAVPEPEPVAGVVAAPGQSS